VSNSQYGLRRQLEAIDALDEAAIIVIYGRRRVGKTELMEQFFRLRAGIHREPIPLE
jgi:AAA+ ATPase superfamily predicted ATPase